MKTVLLVGNPNVGKTALLNTLSGSTYSIGNWAGVTVSKQESWITFGKEQIHILDIPGLYSILPCSEDEGVSVRELFTQDYDLIVNVIDINNLHQNLMLTAELIELGIPMIGVLNFYDEFEKVQELDINKLQETLGFPVIPISAKTNYGIQQLKDLLNLTDNYPLWISNHRIALQEKYQSLEHIFTQAIIRYPLAGFSPNIDRKLILIQLSMRNNILLQKFNFKKEEIDSIIEKHTTEIPNFMQDVIDKKEFIINNNPIQTIKGKKSIKEYTKNIDSILLHPIFGYFSFLGIMLILFTMVFNAANPWIDFIDWLVGEKIKMYAHLLLQDTLPEIQAFVSDGLISGVGSVLTFVPLIFILYVSLAFLEESGYFARAAILLEYPFSKIGLSGKSFFPIMLGLGCTVPAVYGSRVLETPALRRLTAMISPLVSCGARLPVYALFASAFFPQHGSLILFSLYIIGIILAIIFAFIFSRFEIFSSTNNCFVMVLPPYRFPNLKIVLKTASLHAKSYIKNAGGIILGMLILIWGFSYFPSQGDINDSYLARAGKAIQPIFIPLGFGDRWEPVIAIIPSLIAKEAVVGVLGQVLPQEESKESIDDSTEETKLTTFNEIMEISSQFLQTIKTSFIGLVTWNISEQFSPPSEEELEEEGGSRIVVKLRSIWSDTQAPKKAYSFLLFILLTLPCVATIAALKHELEPIYFWITIALYFILPFIVSFVFYQTAILL